MYSIECCFIHFDYLKHQSPIIDSEVRPMSWPVFSPSISFLHCLMCNACIFASTHIHVQRKQYWVVGLHIHTYRNIRIQARSIRGETFPQFFFFVDNFLLLKKKTKQPCNIRNFYQPYKVYIYE